jgi:hypothetical protein
MTGDLLVDGTITPALGTDVADDVFKVHDPVDDTKKARLDAGGVTAGQTRVLAVPDYNGTVATLAGAEALTNKTLTSPKVGTCVCDVNGLELLKVTATADAVNELTLANAAAGTSPVLSATGDDADISIKLTPKGAGKLVVGKRIMDLFTVATKTEASDQPYTAAQILGGMILRDPNGGARQDTLPTAANIVAAIPGAAVGTAFEFTVRNTADANETITVAAPGVPVTLSGTMTIAQNNSKTFLVVLTNVGAGTEAVTVYSLGTSTH